MEQLLRNCWVVCRRADWITVRRSHAHCGKAAIRHGGGRRRLFDAQRRSFCSGVVLVSDHECSVAYDRAVGVVWGLVGISGIVYATVVARRMRLQTVYRPVFEDWLFHVLLPVAAYAMLVVSAFLVATRARPALFLVAAATLVFLFVGVHNAWDAITYHVFVKGQRQQEAGRKPPSEHHVP